MRNKKGKKGFGKSTFAIYRDIEQIKIALRSFVKLGFDESVLWAFQAKDHGSKDFAQVQRYQLRLGSIIGAILGAYLLGGFFVFAAPEMPGGRLLMIAIGVVFGGLFGAAAGILVGIGTPDPVAKRYGQYLQSGGILLSVRSQNSQQEQQAVKILTATGGQEIQRINERKTWNRAKLERILLEKTEIENTNRIQRF